MTNENEQQELFTMTFAFINSPSNGFVSRPMTEPQVKNVFMLGRDSQASPVQLALIDGSMLYLTSELFKHLAITFKLEVETKEEE